MDGFWKLLIFDMDGTLVSSDAMWFEAARGAVARYYEELGVTGVLPDRAQTDALIGEPPGRWAARLVPAEHHSGLERLEELALAEEARILARGGDYAYPGVHACLDSLARGGIHTAIASNCGTTYLRQAMAAASLEGRIELPLCIDTPGVRDKAAMVRRALEHFDTRRAVVVGDRHFDLEAARSNDLPFAAFAGGFSGARDLRDTSDAVFFTWGELTPLLDERRTRLDALAAALGASRARVAAITGRAGTGKSILARELAELLAVRGKRVEIAAFASSPHRRPAPTSDLLLLVAERSPGDPAVRAQVDALIHVQNRVPERVERCADWTVEQGNRLRPVVTPAP